MTPTARCLLVIAATFIGAAPAHAEFPFAVRARGGIGFGGGSANQTSTAGLMGMAAADAVWRRTPGRAIVVTFEGGGGPLGGSYVLDHGSYIDEVSRVALTVNLEVSRPPGPGVASYMLGGVGVGRVTTSGGTPPPGWTPDQPPTRIHVDRTAWGPALAGEVGLRLTPAPGPLGFLLGVRGSGMFAPHSSAGGVAAFFGLTIHPQ